jgi:hypothetical protein
MAQHCVVVSFSLERMYIIPTVSEGRTKDQILEWVIKQLRDAGWKLRAAGGVINSRHEDWWRLIIESDESQMDPNEFIQSVFRPRNYYFESSLCNPVLERKIDLLDRTQALLTELDAVAREWATWQAPKKGG